MEIFEHLSDASGLRSLMPCGILQIQPGNGVRACVSKRVLAASLSAQSLTECIEVSSSYSLTPADLEPPEVDCILRVGGCFPQTPLLGLKTCWRLYLVADCANSDL
jgi:hypothetical protein